MKTDSQRHVLQDLLTADRKMFKFMTQEQALSANHLLLEHKSNARWVLDPIYKQPQSTILSVA